MRDSKEFYVVGMGASAGGLETFQRFFSNMPSDSGLAFVLVQHLHPHHESLMPELLSKSTDMPVLSADEGMEIEPNHVYVIPSNTSLTVVDGNLHIKEPSESRGHRMPIDLFFKSLSEDCGERAICVVLSGTGSDGTLGLKAVKEHGGLAVAQNPDNAKYDSMPRSAIHTGLVDMILDVHEMPEHIINFLNKSKILKKEIEEDDEIELHLDAIFGELEDKTQHEFKGYKRNTILRRIRRRMQILQIDSLEHYAERVKEDNDEAQRLFKDLLIGVTHFFRDAASFVYLQERVIALLLKTKRENRDNSGLRIWVAGCATGEEAYTLALIIREEAAKIKMSMPVQIFATDIDENALSVARRAVYPEGIEDQIPEKYLSRYFSKQGNYYQIHKNIREMCIFSPHNLISDPPYSRIDLITCRNLLIYFDNSLQRKILPIFHYSLNPGGYLFLGPSENISARPELFKATSKVHKVFQACENVPPAVIDLPVGRRSPRSFDAANKPFSERKRENEKMLAKAFERRVLEKYVPFSAVINENADILYWAGPRTKYLDPPRGIPRNNLLEIAHKSLRLNLRSGIHKVVSTGGEIQQHDVVVQTTEGLQRLEITLTPFNEMGDNSGLIFVVIHEVGPPKSSTEREVTDHHASGEEINRQLEEELRDTKSYLQSTIEELETSNEELKSSNEELLSMNEELQSSNEELQTSKEELQSVNEELETVNAELKNKVQELDAANSDLHNLYESTQIATLFLDNDLNIKAFTPAATELFRMIESDISRPIGDIVTRFKGANLVKEARAVLKKLDKRHREVTHKNSEKHYIMQMMPYRTVNNIIDGVSISFIDITAIKKAKQDLEIRERMLRLVTNSVPALIAYVDSEKKYRYCNTVYEDWFDLKREKIVGKTIREVLGEESYEKLLPNIDKVLTGEPVTLTTPLNFKKIGEKIVAIRYEPHVNDGEVCGFIVHAHDVSEQMIRERKLGRLAAIVNSTHEVIIGKTDDGVITDWNIGAEELYGYTAEEVIGKNISIIVPEEKQSELDSAYKQLLKGEVVAPFETTRITKDGKIKYVSLSLAAIKSSDEETLGISAVAHDISDRVSYAKKLAELNENLEKRVEERTEQLHNLTARFLGMEQRERRNFSQYLHDEIQQSLAAARMLVEKAHTSIKDKTISPTLSEGLRLLSETIQKTRTITTDMSPPLMFDSGLSICLQWVTRWAKAKLGLEVEGTVEGDDRPVADEIGYLLFRSIKELLFNVQKHAGVQQAEITVGFDDSGNLEVSVIDRGKGFDPEIIMQSSSEHFGLLSVVEQVRAMQGSIDFDSAKNKGTRVTMVLPATAVEAIKNNSVVPSRSNGSHVAENRKRLKDEGGNKRTILIVDDQLDLRYTLRLMLEDLSSDYIFLEAENAEEASEIVTEFGPEVVLMDISMPGISGLDATKKLLAANSDIKVIGLSMHDREDMETTMLEAGATAYLTKDSSAEKILAVIENCLQG